MSDPIIIEQLLRHRSRRLILTALPVALTFAACTNQRSAVRMPGCDSTTSRSEACLTILFFGLSSEDGSGVSEQEWQAFLADVVTPRFPAGFTVLEAMGQYQHSAGAGIVAERTKVLLLVHGRNAATADSIDQVKNAYRSQFRQESVLQTTGEVHLTP